MGRNGREQFKVELEGVEQVEAALDSLLGDVADKVKSLIAEETDQVHSIAASNAPEDRGNYKAGIELEISAGGMVGRVIGRDEKSHWVEYGTYKDPAQRIITGALDSRKAAIDRKAKGIADNASL